MGKPRFWPLDYDPEGEVYENVAWGLPGFRRRPRSVHRKGGGRLADRARTFAKP